MKSIFILAIALMATSSVYADSFSTTHNGRSYTCYSDEDEVPGIPSPAPAPTPTQPPVEDWQCSTSESGRTGNLLANGCNGNRKWSCVVTVTETCRETHSGRTQSRTRTESRGCAVSLSDCF